MHKFLSFLFILSLTVSLQAQKVDALTQMPQTQTNTPSASTKPQMPKKAQKNNNKATAPRKHNTPSTSAGTQMPAVTQPNTPGTTAKEQMPPATQYLKETTTVPYKVPHKIVQKRHKATRQGVHSLKKKNFSDAVTQFRNALTADSSYAKAQYNAAIAHASLQQNDTALAYYLRVCENSSATREQRAHSHYNAGNIHLRKALACRDTGGYDGQSLRSAIAEYQSSLRLDPTNAEAQHNLSLAKQLLRPESENSGGGNGQKQNENKDQNQSQDQNQNKDQNQNQNQNQNENENENENQQQQQQQQQQQNKRDSQQQEQRRREAEQMLNAMKNNEQQTMRAIRKKEAEKERRQGSPARIEKDW